MARGREGDWAVLRCREEIGVSSQRAVGKFGHRLGGVRGGGIEEGEEEKTRQTDPGQGHLTFCGQMGGCAIR